MVLFRVVVGTEVAIHFRIQTIAFLAHQNDDLRVLVEAVGEEAAGLEAGACQVIENIRAVVSNIHIFVVKIKKLVCHFFKLKLINLFVFKFKFNFDGA